MSSRRIRGFLAPLFLFAVAASAFVASSMVDAADPPSATVSPSQPSAQWRHTFVLPSVISPSGCDPSVCDPFRLTVDLGAASGDLEIEVRQSDLSVPSVEVYDAAGKLVGESSGLRTAILNLADVVAGTYTVQVFNGAVLPNEAYEATATLKPKPLARSAATAGGDTVLYDTDDAPVLSAEVPLRVVLVGFEPGEFSEADVFSQIPDHQQVGVLFTYENETRDGDDGLPGGVQTLVNHGRVYYEANEPNVLPVEYRWKPELHYAPQSFTQGLFAHMVESSRAGEYADPVRRLYLELYNASRGSALRVAASGDPAQAVAPTKPVRFVDGESTEDWIAEHAPSELGFPVGRDPGTAGYTLFVLNTWDGPEAAAFPKGEYHVFRVNRTDPDRGDFDGIDWARVWGGRYRFMMLDVGAAPNPYESETWGNRGRTPLGSAVHDPPLWEFRAGAPRLLDTHALVDGGTGFTEALTPGATWDAAALTEHVARTLNEAVNYRFFHSYLYEPRPGTGRFFLSDNIWHDATTLYRSDLEKLYDQQAALNGLRTLTPYFEFDGDVVYEYLDDVAAHPEYAADQAALDKAKIDGDDVAGVPGLSLHTATMMDYLDANPERFLRGGPCATTTPTIQVVVPGHFAWALPVAAGIATNRGGVPWGFLNSVNDVTKWNGADKDQTLVLAHPNVLFNGAFTYTTVHEASHYLGLAHPHDTVGAVRGENGEPRYYDGFTWTFNTTASPTTYSHAETIYSILDQESIARGHASYYTSWAREALHEAGLALVENGIETVSQLAPEAAGHRALALAKIAEAQALFADFRFVSAAFAAQDGWRAAARFRDTALGLAAGTSQLERGTQKETDEALAVAGCSATPPSSGPAPDYQPGPAPRAGEAGIEVAPETVGGAAHDHDHGVRADQDHDHDPGVAEEASKLPGRPASGNESRTMPAAVAITVIGLVAIALLRTRRLAST